jgi:uncharacterized membrane protein
MTTVKELIEDLQTNFKDEDEVVWATIIDYSEFAENLKEEYGVTLPLDVWKEAVKYAPTGDDIMGIQGVIQDEITARLKKRGIELIELEA